MTTIIEELLQSIDWISLLSAVWTIIFVPIGKQLYEYLKSEKLDKYAVILYEEVVKAVKNLYETTVKDIKDNPDLWTKEKQYQVKQIAKRKVIQALTSITYKSLKEANKDFNDYLDSLIDTALYDIKNGLK